MPNNPPSPSTQPTWGRVSAKPHECLLILRHGQIHSMQQGGSVFKWPGDTVARVDTSVQRLQFTADQVTQEKTGVSVTGLAVFRIVRPELAFRMLDLDNPSAVADILREMFVGATRRLVANLTLDDCMTRRKAALATELMSEVAPVVQGQGKEEDHTACGWGVVIDTIEVQDVRVLSEEVFERLQAPYRKQLALDALQASAELAVEKAKVDKASSEEEERRRQELMAIQEARLEADRRRESKAAAHKATLRREALTRAAEDAAMEVEAALAVRTLQAEGEVEVADLQAQAEQRRGETEAHVLRLLRQAQDAIGEARLQEIALTETLPKVAAAFANSFDQAVVTGGDLGFLSAGVGQVLGTLQAFGVALPGAPRDGSC